MHSPEQTTQHTDIPKSQETRHCARGHMLEAIKLIEHALLCAPL